ncbi:MAG: caspase family protein [Planctomycetes bacterium]|nr:caspase family protein [Planctomycetota bacterium]
MITATLVCGLLAMIQAPATEPVASPRKFALLIGVDAYPAAILDQDFKQIYGATRDVAAMSELLRTRFAFDPIIELKNEDATLGRVIRAFTTDLGANVRRGDVVFVFFAGHGSTVPDMATHAAGSESAQADNTLVLFDSRSSKHHGDRDLTDDMLHSLVAPLLARGAHVFVATDACHSAGVMRGAEARTDLPVRLAPKGSAGVGESSLPNEWPPDVKFIDDEVAPSQSAQSGTYVHIAACEKEQLAQEWYFEVENPSTARGAFTCWLQYALEHADSATTTYQDVFAAVRWYRPWFHLDLPQTPTADGSLSRLLFDGAYVERPGRYVSRRVTDDRLEIGVGSLSGVEIGTVFRVLDGTGAILGEVTVDELQFDRSFAAWKEARSVESAPTQARYVDWLTLPRDTEPITIFDPDGLVHDLIGSHPAVRYVTSGLYLAQLSKPNSPSDERRDEIEVRASDGAKLVSVPVPDTHSRGAARKALIDAIEDEVSFQALMRLMGTRSELRVSARFDSPNPDELGRFCDFRRVDEANLGDPPLQRTVDRNDPNAERVTHAPLFIRRGGDDLEYRCGHHRALNRRQLGILEVMNEADRPVFVYVLSLMDNHERDLIHPRRTAEITRIEPGRPERVPFLVEVPDDWPTAKPFRDHYLVITSDEPLPIEDLLQKKQDRGGPSRMPGILRRALEGDVMRGQPVVAEVAEFGLIGLQLTIQLEE